MFNDFSHFKSVNNDKLTNGIKHQYVIIQLIKTNSEIIVQGKIKVMVEGYKCAITKELLIT